MKRRAIVAGLAALLLLASGLMHAAFACSAALHPAAIARAAAHPASHHDCQDRSARPCCRQPAPTLALQQKADPVAGAGATFTLVAVPPWRSARHLGPPDRVTAMPSAPTRAAGPRLLLVSLLL